ncbi:uncharacterized protein LOC135122200 [Zophobas morio]|uniref:uncharacterized protein LOC135122200 n=1 Tax=Zophobas morio TaxID=2755281 RepID=UPI003082B1B1
MNHCSKKLFIKQILLSLPGSIAECSIQGIIVDIVDPNRVILDDGTDVILVNLTLLQTTLKAYFDFTIGMYAFVAGRVKSESNIFYILCDKLVNLSEEPNRESLWNIEVVYAALTFYKKNMKKVLFSTGNILATQF